MTCLRGAERAGSWSSLPHMRSSPLRSRTRRHVGQVHLEDEITHYINQAIDEVKPYQGEDRLQIQINRIGSSTYHQGLDERVLAAPDHKDLDIKALKAAVCPELTWPHTCTKRRGPARQLANYGEKIVDHLANGFRSEPATGGLSPRFRTSRACVDCLVSWKHLSHIECTMETIKSNCGAE